MAFWSPRVALTTHVAVDSEKAKREDRDCWKLGGRFGLNYNGTKFVRHFELFAVVYPFSHLDFIGAWLFVSRTFWRDSFAHRYKV
jgi:hypothetical protein